MNVALGLDTSAYTTSVALVAPDGTVVADERRVLEVKQGQKGLRQSEALFQHVTWLPVLFEAMAPMLKDTSVIIVGASVSPRTVEGSYMPVFRASEGWGRSLAALLGVAFVPMSHQAGHLWAGIRENPVLRGTSFLALHLSGGTSEVLQVSVRQNGLMVQKLGGTTDLHAGQFIDRVGVALGLPFPCGPALEELARQADLQEIPVVPVSVQGVHGSFSGPTTAALRLIDQGVRPPEVAAGVQISLAKTVAKLLQAAAARTGLTHILCVGGVTANLFLRAELKQALPGNKILFAGPNASRDNAIGTAFGALAALDDQV